MRALEILGPSLAKLKMEADKEKCAGDTQYRRAHFNAGCVHFVELDDVDNISCTLYIRGATSDLVPPRSRSARGDVMTTTTRTTTTTTTETAYKNRFSKYRARQSAS